MTTERLRLVDLNLLLVQLFEILHLFLLCLRVFLLSHAIAYSAYLWVNCRHIVVVTWYCLLLKWCRWRSRISTVIKRRFSLSRHFILIFLRPFLLLLWTWGAWLWLGLGYLLSFNRLVARSCCHSCFQKGFLDSRTSFFLAKYAVSDVWCRWLWWSHCIKELNIALVCPWSLKDYGLRGQYTTLISLIKIIIQQVVKLLFLKLYRVHCVLRLGRRGSTWSLHLILILIINNSSKF